jgi:uncharacterized protein YraI
MKAIRNVAVAALIIFGLPGSALAATAVAVVDVNVRSGPGPEFPVVDYLEQDAAAELVGCLADSKWCQVRKADALGWSYGDYLAINTADGNAVVIGDTWPPAGLPTVAYTPPGGGVYAPARPLRRLVAPARRAIPGPRFDPPPPAVQSYVIENTREPVLLDGEVVVGAAVPDDVELYEVPDYQYRYTYVNQVPVLVQPDTRRVVYIYR